MSTEPTRYWVPKSFHYTAIDREGVEVVLASAYDAKVQECEALKRERDEWKRATSSSQDELYKAMQQLAASQARVKELENYERLLQKHEQFQSDHQMDTLVPPERFDQLVQAEQQLAASQARVKEMEERKDEAYLERNRVVAALSKLFPSGVAKTAIAGWSDDWHGCVYIDLPTGQVSWHFHDSHAGLFAHLPPYQQPWDGHTTEQKYARLAGLSAESLQHLQQQRDRLKAALQDIERDVDICTYECPHCGHSDPLSTFDFASIVKQALAEGEK